MMACFAAQGEREPITCPGPGCGYVLAERVGEVYIIRHGKRVWVVRELLGTECPGCGRGWDANCESA